MKTIKEIIKQFEDLVAEGNENILINNVATYDKANKNSIIWLGSKIIDKEQVINNTLAGLVISEGPLKMTEIDLTEKAVIISSNPRLDFIRVSNLFDKGPYFSGVDNSVKFVGENKISESVEIGASCLISNCIIGSNVTIYPNCTIHNAIIGSNVNIFSGAQIGTDGFGYESAEDGTLIKFSHFGRVIINDNVDIGSNTCIDRGSINDTVIGEGSKIDNLVHIAHNVQIGKNCVIIAQSMIGGSTIVEDNVWVSPSSVIRDGLVLGRNSLIGMGAIVTKNIPENEIWIGNPAKFFKLRHE
jgi:UDP-3-O-[3-hydroxymyristoyl] glucosamine N-acyltransferase